MSEPSMVQAPEDEKKTSSIEVANSTIRCKFRGYCTKPDQAELVICSSCQVNYVHELCFQTFFKEILVDNDKVYPIVCGKKCYNNLTNAATMTAATPNTTGTASTSTDSNTGAGTGTGTMAMQKKRISWKTDGPTPGVTSMSLLIAWLKSNENYNRWRGGFQDNGMYKKTIANEISTYFNENGISRTAKDIHSRICKLEKKFKIATDWLKRNGVGHHNDNGVIHDESLKKLIMSRCPQYYYVVDVMKERPSTPAPIPIRATTAHLMTSIATSNNNGNYNNNPTRRNASNNNNNNNNDNESCASTNEEHEANGYDSETSIDVTSNHPLLAGFNMGDENHTKNATISSVASLAEKRNHNSNDDDTTRISFLKRKKKKHNSMRDNLSSFMMKREQFDMTMTFQKQQLELEKLKFLNEEKYKERQICVAEEETKLKMEQKKLEHDQESIRIRLLENESIAKIQTIKIQTEAEKIKVKVELLRQREALKKEGISQADIDLLLPLKEPEL